MKLDDSGQLSLDFLIGFTIFLVAFIIVITMTSGLIVSLMSKTIDYDAVAYRTGVILVEDPGIGILGERLDENIVTKWEDITTTFWADDIYRAGLAATNDLIKKKYPGILSQEKISRLVELNSITKNEFVHEKVLFDKPVHQGGASLYSYRYYITLKSIGDGGVLEELGESEHPYNTGYIKRVVKINLTYKTPIDVYSQTQPGTGSYIVSLNLSDQSLYSLYQPDPWNEGVYIVLSNVTPAMQANFSNVSFYQYADPPVLINGSVPNSTKPYDNKIEVNLDPDFFDGIIEQGYNYYFKFNFTPDTTVGGSTKYAAFLPAILEVYIW
ncbi:MAG TPA: hypothetical protein PLN56_09305 [Methanoregulaceae archaeon]|nr:hypothetical protein [Methanoregulaceae archaeon]HPD11173.1 hypothetical protein [Methanoregulaceae archaeon]HRT16177.1 hypothetical protein [Methanoregulaceae archaeon]HRU31740.1 hypothetical protein [Methanoregulaceae archaeon]